MKIAAISTSARVYLLSNYGSFFQHYALRQVLKSFGIGSFRVRPCEEHCSRLSRGVEFVKDVIRPYYWLFAKFAERTKYVKRLQFRRKLNKKFLRDFRRLIGPLDEPMSFTDRTYGIKGGDQVLYPGDDTMWLRDIPEGNPKICYAASRDWRSLAEDEESQLYLRNRLSTFTAIGIRESCGVEMISHITKREGVVAQVADPVLLLSADQLRSVASKKSIFCKPTLLCYLVNIGDERQSGCDRFRQLAIELNCELKIVGIQGAETAVPTDLLINLGPTEFLRAVDDAQYFLTNSFHGLVFGIIFQKQLLFLPQAKLPGCDQNERQKELLARHGMLDRLVESDSSAEVFASTMRSDIVWSDVETIRVDERERSIRWLKNALGLKQ